MCLNDTNMYPAQRIVDAFGGITKLVEALDAVGVKLHRVAVYQWCRPREKGGTGGRIPSHRIDQIKRAGRWVGVLITEDMFCGDGR